MNSGLLFIKKTILYDIFNVANWMLQLYLSSKLDYFMSLSGLTSILKLILNLGWIGLQNCQKIKFKICVYSTIKRSSIQNEDAKNKG